MVDNFNNNLFGKCQNEKVVIPAMDTIMGDLSNTIKEKLVLTISNDPTKTAGLYNPL